MQKTDNTEIGIFEFCLAIIILFIVIGILKKAGMITEKKEKIIDITNLQKNN